MVLQATMAELLGRIPGGKTAAWPAGERFSKALAHGSMSVELYAPVGDDPQTPHEQDELYFIQTGEATLVVRNERHPCVPGSAVFVPAGADHRFENLSADFSTWVVFWGPTGGEAA
ncbi:MAG: cupin domain-containing protein [Burkholderiaceae bacterium]